MKKFWNKKAGCESNKQTNKQTKQKHQSRQYKKCRYLIIGTEYMLSTYCKINVRECLYKNKLNFSSLTAI